MAPDSEEHDEDLLPRNAERVGRGYSLLLFAARESVQSSIPGLFSLQRMPPSLLFQAIVRVRVRAIVLLFYCS